jgi:hypothetical protein
MRAMPTPAAPGTVRRRIDRDNREVHRVHGA